MPVANPGPALTVPAMKFSWFLALRYLKPKRTFISIITVISILGVALGVGVLLVVIAVMSGFEKRIKDEWLKVEPPLFLLDDTRSWLAETTDEPEADPLWRELLPQLKSFPGVANASPYINVVAMLQQSPERDFDSNRVEVNPSDLPPAEPPPPPQEEGQENAAPPEAPAPDAPAAPSQPDTPAKDEPDVPGGPPPVPDAPSAPSPPDATGPEEEAPDTSNSPPPAAKKETVTGLDRTHPLAHAVIIGVDPDDVDQMARLERRFGELKGRKNPFAWGEFDVSGETIVLSHDLALKFSRGAKVGPITIGRTRINAFGPHFINEGFDMIEENREAKGDPEKQKEIDAKDRVYPASEDLTITGIFNDDKQPGVAYVSLRTAQRLAGAGKAVDGIAIELADPYDAPPMAEKIEMAGLLPDGWRMETWIERHRQQFEAVSNERSMMYLVLGVISVVAAFSMMNTMITFAVQKRREIGMMRALGAKTSHIVSLFLTKGFIVGVLGTALGYGLGLLVLEFRNNIRSWINDTFGHQIFDSSIYGLTEIPAELRTLDQVSICAIGLVLCTLSALIPAFLVGRMEPARALRNDR